jgi:GTP-binding protein HflX
MEIENLIHIDIAPQKALLAGIYRSGSEKEECMEYLHELERLGETLGVETVGKVPCLIKKFEASTYLGSGKIEELVEMAKSLGATVFIIDDEITPAQQRNLEQLFKIPVIDRTEVILEVFSKHAKTKEAKVQVELAKIRYELPRLKRLWTHLSRQRGGGVNQKGEGEKQIEIDRRILKRKVETLTLELEKIKAHRATQRVARQRSHIPTFAIIGYTNVGKSTLLKALTDADVLVEDKLFATLDTTTRKFILPNNQEILLIDTVGFIRKIPHTLVAAFRSTLEESVEADILLHLVDISHPMAFEQAKSTYEVLKELNAEKKPIITVLNKLDACTNKKIIDQMRLTYPKTVMISAKSKEGFLDLLDRMTEELEAKRKKVTIKIPQKDFHLLRDVEEHGQIFDREYEDNDIIIKFAAPEEIADRLKKYWI